MGDVAIKIQGLGKRYKIGQRASYRLLTEAIPGVLAAPFRKHKDEVESGYIWALKDVTFEVKKGEVIGIIGRNGAGKSTLLKIISRITEMTEGSVDIYGRIGSLLEVGTGFHPELSGRENIYLNGAIIGMKRAEIRRKFDEIVEFSEIAKFLDTPVKHYSSGMYMRLAFAVAAHLEPEILMIDEVLAVGDAAFQKKCLGKMGEVAKEGRTVLFVSHNMGAVSQMCARAIWIDQGQISLAGAASNVISAYLSAGATAETFWTHPSDCRSMEVQFKTVRTLNGKSQPSALIEFKDQCLIEIAYQVQTPVHDLSILARISDSDGHVLFTSWDTDATTWRGQTRAPGHYRSICRIPGALLKPGKYFVSIGAQVTSSRSIDYHDGILMVAISPVSYPLNLDRYGLFTPVLDWDVLRE